MDKQKIASLVCDAYAARRRGHHADYKMPDVIRSHPVWGRVADEIVKRPGMRPSVWMDLAWDVFSESGRWPTHQQIACPSIMERVDDYMRKLPSLTAEAIEYEIRLLSQHADKRDAEEVASDTRIRVSPVARLIFRRTLSLGVSQELSDLVKRQLDLEPHVREAVSGLEGVNL